MDRGELERWLCGPDAPLHTPLAVAAALGLPGLAVADTTLLRTAPRVRALRFILAVLHDAFADDDDMERWLAEPNADCDGAAPREMLRAGRTDIVEALVVKTWNDAPWMAGVA